jgi:hypothetical protein
MRKIIMALAALGMTFSGMLTLQHYFTGQCLGGCALLFSYPTCIYGFFMFALILGFTMMGREDPRAMYVTLGTAIAGMIFSFWFFVKETSVCWFCYDLGLPSCAYGLLIYTAVAFLAMRELGIVPKKATKKA